MQEIPEIPPSVWVESECGQKRTREEEETRPVLEKEDVQGIDYVAHLLRLGLLLCTLTERHVEFLCREVQVLTHQRASIQLSHRLTPLAGTFSILPLQFNTLKYGYLLIARDRNDPLKPAISLFTSHMMAQTLSYIVHMLEQHLWLQTFGKNVPKSAYIRLTKREQRVLALLCQGCSSDEIVERLMVSPTTVSSHRQHIYEQLGVHNEYDARIAAYNLGLFSFLKEEEE